MYKNKNLYDVGYVYAPYIPLDENDDDYGNPAVDSPDENIWSDNCLPPDEDEV